MKVLALVLATACSCFAAKWVRTGYGINKEGHGFSFYYDASSVIKNKEVIGVWVRQDYDSVIYHQGVETSYTMMHVNIKCEENEISNGSLAVYDGNDKVTYYSNDEVDKYHPVVPESVMENVVKAVCKR